MDDVRAAAESFLDDHPEWESELRTLLEHDESAPWTFEEVPLDSGQFGEVVSHGLVTETDDGYRLTDPDALERALDGEAPVPDSQSRGGLQRRLGGVETYLWKGRLHLSLLLAALLVTAFLRTVFGYAAVFRGEHVVLNANDSYLTVYWVEHLHEGMYALTDPGTWANFPDGFWDHDLLAMVLLWAASGVAGGANAVGWILAWYPVVAGVLVGAVVYGIATRMTADRRVGLAAVLLYAVTPATVNRTMIGFADTEGFDFLWLTLTVLAVVVLATGRDDAIANWSGRLAIAVLGLSVAAQTLTWRGGPLLLVPLALYIVLGVVSTYRTERSLTTFLTPILAGLLLASVLTVGTHLLFGWLQSYRAIAPALVLAGAVATLGHFTLARRRDVRLSVATGSFAVAGLVGFGLLWLVFPPLSTGLVEFIEYMQAYTWGEIIETQSIFSASRGTWFGPFFYLGFGFLFGLGGLVAVTWLTASRHSPAWLGLAVYGWYFLILTVVQLRFAGYFGLFNAVLAGCGFVHFLAALDLAKPLEWVPTRETLADRRPSQLVLPDRQVVAYVVVLFAVVASLGLVQLPAFHADLAHDDESYESATFIEEYSDERETTYPSNYVFSEWGENRLYNYIVSSHSHSYHFARHNYGTFLSATEPTVWYERLSERTGFIVTSEREGYPAQTLQTRLHDNYGSATTDTPALERYRVLYTAPDNSVTVFALVEGATVRGTGPANESFTVSTTVTLPPAGTEITYEQHVQTDETGTFEFTTPHPGTYEIGNRSVEVGEAAVRNGSEIHLDEETG